MNSGASEHFKRYLRRSQSGQSLVILAIGFFALVGFVGIVTDVSLLFVRYSTLRRAVDAAAVAAAGQMRRVDAATPGEDQAQSYANMGLAARQFIEFYGLNPSSVTVETCHVTNSASVTPDPALCTLDERKLVRVTAQVDSPTTFFSLFGFGTIRLQAESISETAVLDLVFIMDVSESMLNETTYTDWETVPQPDGTTVNYGRRYLPPVLQYPRSPNYADMAQAWQRLSGTSNELILRDVLDASGTGSLVTDLVISPGMEKVRTFGLGQEPRRECTVRFWPGSVLKSPQTNPAQIDDYISLVGGIANFRTWFGLSGSADVYTDAAWRGFVPMYDYYGCCNDPNGDWDMSDLVCQPFRRARDASIDFMARLDFIRGDRVAIVTFDRRATLMDPDPSDVDPENPDLSDTRDAMIYSQEIAELVMRERVGVRTEESFYVDSGPVRDGRWDAVLDKGEARGPIYFATEPIQNIVDHPVRNACPYDSAILNYPYSLYLDREGNNYRSPFYVPNTGSPGAPGGIPVLLDEIDTLPAWFEAYVPAGDGYIRDPVPSAAVDPYEFTDRLERSYEYRGSCAGTNIGEGLAKASETLGRLGRREGAVWIMVLLSDGAAGASSPAVRNGTLAALPNPYNESGINGGTQPVSPQEYGVFGLCPYGSDISNAGELLQDRNFPYCSDLLPQTRNYCNDDNAGAVETIEQRGPNRIDLDDEPSCEQFYDVDDYARDWADYISVRGINVYQQSVTGINVSGSDASTLLPTLFTIGFGLEFDRPAGSPSCIDNPPYPPPTGNPVYDCNIESYLGEELLRYIADAGDNFQIDTDYWQQALGYRIPNRVADLNPDEQPDWGPRGPCEQPTGTRGVWAPLAPGEDCGNYFSAASGSSADLNSVFAEIASRMFTRLSG